MCSPWLPAPWAVKYRDGGFLPWAMAGSITCLIMDILLNIGGVGFFMSKLHTSDIGQQQFNMSQTLVSSIETIATIAFATLCAVGSELLDEFANYIEHKPQGNHAGGMHSIAKESMQQLEREAMTVRSKQSKQDRAQENIAKEQREAMELMRRARVMDKNDMRIE